MYRLIIKKFSDKIKIEEAKKRAMKLYEEMLNKENISKNRQLEESLSYKKENNIEPNNFNNTSNLSIRNKGKNNSENYENKVKEVLASYKLINPVGEKFSFSSDSNYSKIENNILLYKLKQNKLNNKNISENLEQNIWLNIYENKENEKFENLKKYLFILFKLILGLKTYQLIKKILVDKKEYEKYQYIGMICFYSSLCLIFTMNRSFNKRVVKKIMLNTNHGDLVRIIFEKKQNIFETKIGNLYSITSKRKNVHEIFYYNINNKVDQLFVPKNAFYDPLLLMNICHPLVKQVKIMQ